MTRPTSHCQRKVNAPVDRSAAPITRESSGQHGKLHRGVGSSFGTGDSPERITPIGLPSHEGTVLSEQAMYRSGKIT